jgi:hypothetical protein
VTTIGRARVVYAAAAALCLLGLLGIPMRSCGILSAQEALSASLQDPAKLFFHVALLPLAALALGMSFPDGLGAAARRSPGYAIAVGAICMGLAGWLTITDPSNGLCKRPPMPEDVRAPCLARKLHGLRHGRPNGPSKLLSWGPGLLGKYDRCKNLFWGPRNRCTFWKDASCYAWYAAFLSAIGHGAAGILVWLTAMWVWSQRQPTPGPGSRETGDSLLLAASLLALWIPLRMYSDWYARFGEFHLSDHPPLLLAIALAAVVLLLVPSQPERSTVALLATKLAGAAGVSNLAVLAEPKWLDSAAGVVRHSSPCLLMATYAVLGGGLLLAVVGALPRRGWPLASRPSSE